MVSLLYQFLAFLSRFVGAWVFNSWAFIISTGFYLFARKRVGVSRRFYRALIPGRSRLFYERCALRQYHSFSRVVIDRMLFHTFGNVTYTSTGFEYLQEAAANKTGAVVLMSHMGNWEVAAHFFRKRNLPLLLYMGARQKEQLEKMQKETLSRSGIRIMVTEQDQGDPFGLLEGVGFLKKGGLVSMAGDRIWRPDQRTVPVEFLGHEALLPESPHLFALLSGAPLIVFFVLRTGEKTYHIEATPPSFVRAARRDRRGEAVRESAQRYADILASMVRRYPFQWYHFEPVLGTPIVGEIKH